MRLTPTQRRAIEAARQVTVDVEPKLVWLEAVAKEAPQYADDVRELRDMRDHLNTICEACVAGTSPPAG